MANFFKRLLLSINQAAEYSRFLFFNLTVCILGAYHLSLSVECYLLNRLQNALSSAILWISGIALIGMRFKSWFNFTISVLARPPLSETINLIWNVRSVMEPSTLRLSVLANRISRISSRNNSMWACGRPSLIRFLNRLCPNISPILWKSGLVNPGRKIEYSVKSWVKRRHFLRSIRMRLTCQPLMLPESTGALSGLTFNSDKHFLVHFKMAMI